MLQVFLRTEGKIRAVKNTRVICFTLDNIRFDADLLKHPTLAFSHRVQKSVLHICVSFSVLHIEGSGREGGGSGDRDGEYM